jgi:hypothetical protein
LTELVAANEMGWDGFAWGTDPAEIARAKATVHLARARYLSNYVKFWDQLSVFIAMTQSRAAQETAPSRFWPRMKRRLLWAPRISLFTSLARNSVIVLRHQGPVEVWRKSRYWIVRGAQALIHAPRP